MHGLHSGSGYPYPGYPTLPPLSFKNGKHYQNFDSEDNINGLDNYTSYDNEGLDLNATRKSDSQVDLVNGFSAPTNTRPTELQPTKKRRRHPNLKSPDENIKDCSQSLQFEASSVSYTQQQELYFQGSEPHLIADFYKQVTLKKTDSEYFNKNYKSYVRFSAAKETLRGSINTFPKPEQDLSACDYEEMAMKLALEHNHSKVKRSDQRSDFVLVYSKLDADHDSDRKKFISKLKDDGLETYETVIGSHVYVEIFASFDRLCEEAEKVCIQMPLSVFHVQKHGNWKGVMANCFKSMQSEEEMNFVSIPFNYASLDLFRGHKDPQTFFRPAYRSMLVNSILQNTKISISDDSQSSEILSSGLSSLLVKNIFTDAFIVHERSELDAKFPLRTTFGPPTEPLESFNDRRKNLHLTWLRVFKFQPLRKIRNYFGEKIALYFAWLGVLITSLWIPVIIGVGVFFYGFIEAHEGSTNSIDELKKWVTKALDNDVTPYFALLICLWGTVFLEVWRRKNAELAYLWAVDNYEEQEPDRPQFYGTKVVKDPFTGRMEVAYPLWKKVIKSMGSISVILFMMLMVVTSVVSVVVFKVVSRVDWFHGERGELFSSLTASVLNSVSILLLGYFYKLLAYKLTDWENHRTRTLHEDALIFKLFGFQFVNSYASLYYIAFFREQTGNGVFQMGALYSDKCGVDNDCMSLLSLQVAVLMIVKPMPKLCSDIVFPFIMRLLKRCFRCCISRLKNRVQTSKSPLSSVYDDEDREYDEYLVWEAKKPPASDFTLSEYTEKVIQYGYLMLFAAAFPLAPLIALLINLIDLRIDARRLLWFNRRPVPERAQDIGMWFTILAFLNYVGVVTNAFLVGLTSRYGRSFKTVEIIGAPVNATFNGTVISTSHPTQVTVWNNLWIIILFENIVLAIKFLLAYVIPDVPEKVDQAMKKEKHELDRLLAQSGRKRGPGKSISLNSKQASTTRRVSMDGGSAETHRLSAKGRKKRQRRVPSEEDSSSKVPGAVTETAT